MRTPARADDRVTLADLAARGIAVARIGIGVAATLAPRAASHYQFRGADPSLSISVRMLGARDLALGIGALMAARRGPSALRGWVEAGMIADAVDALAFARADGDDARLRRLTALVAASTAACGAWAARQLA